MSLDKNSLSRRALLKAAGSTVAAGALGRGLPLTQLASGATFHPAAEPASTTQHFYSEPALAPPVINLKTSYPGQAAGYIVTDSHGVGQQGPLIFDANGHLVWFEVVSSDGKGDRRAFNVRVQTYQGKPVLSYFLGTVTEGHGVGDYMILDTSYNLVKTVTAGNKLKGDLHEFLITPQGTALFTCYLLAYGDLTSVGGTTNAPYWCGVAQELDIATNTVVHQWRSDQHVAFTESYWPIPGNGAPWDYFHINSINIDPADGNLVISGRHCSAAYKVNRSSGEVMWRLGGKLSDFQMGPGAAFAFQHDITPHAGGYVSIFDNGDEPPTFSKQSRGLLLLLDATTKTANVADQYLHSPSLLATDQGSMQCTASDTRVVGWGPTAWFSEYTADGRVLLDGYLEGGVFSYRAFKAPWNATPQTTPSAAVVTASGRTTVYASWNGSTAVASWQVLGGSSPSNLEPLTKAGKNGFETGIPLTTTPAYLAVAAVDASGAELGRSAVMAG
jgi:hypothetical protein